MQFAESISSRCISQRSWFIISTLIGRGSILSADGSFVSILRAFLTISAEGRTSYRLNLRRLSCIGNQGGGESSLLTACQIDLLVIVRFSCFVRCIASIFSATVHLNAAEIHWPIISTLKWIAKR